MRHTPARRNNRLTPDHGAARPRQSASPGCLILCAFLCALAYAHSRAEPQAISGFRYWDVAETAQTPMFLSATGLYADIKTGKMIADAHPFEVNSPLWSDGAHKQRWVLLKPGRSIAFAEKDDYWGYPDSTVFVKQFAIDTVAGDTASRRLWETRLLINKREVIDSATMARMDRWYGFSYKWNAARTDAKWVGKYDLDDTIRTYPQGKSKPAVLKKWTFPADECGRCHLSEQLDTVHSRSVLGFFTAQLNRPAASNPNLNQLDDLFAKGVLKGAKPPNWNRSPRWRPIEDSTATINVRARSYIAANCSGCHGRRGNANFAAEQCSLLYDYQAMDDSLFEFRHHGTADFFGMSDSLPRFYPVSDKGNNPRGLDNLEIWPELVVPGYPQKSAVLARQRARNTAPDQYGGIRDQMPPYGSYEVNEPAIALLTKWILEMPRIPPQDWQGTALMAGRAHTGAGPLLKGDRILVVPEGTPAGTGISMIGIDGRVILLRPLGGDVYAVPENAPRGIYIVRIGNRGFKRALP